MEQDNREIFSEIYDKYIDKIYRFVFLKVSSREIAQDITSETFLRGWKVFKNPDAKKIENPQAFLYQIARNLIVDHYREKGKAKIISVEYTEITDFETNLEEKSLLKSDVESVKKSLENIKDEYRDVIIWRYLDDLSIPEIAEIAEKSEGAVRVTLHRALKALREKMINN